MPIYVYLAGPDVFSRQPLKIGKEKKSICEKYGLAGVFPMDHWVASERLSDAELGYSIGAMSERWMHACDAMIVNLTPFHGPSMDVGSAYEVGFMRALGKPVFGYSNVASGFAARVSAFFDDNVRRRKDGRLEDHLEMEIEEFGFVENLMIDHGVVGSGGFIHTRDIDTDCRQSSLEVFESCVRDAAKALGSR